MTENPIYIEYNFSVTPKIPGNEILIAELGYLGFESFVEHDNGVLAYIQKKEHNEALLKEVMILDNEEFTIHFTTKEIEQVNWNAEWEKNFNPIVVDDLCTVRAPFHEVKSTQYDIVIEPKMSFGTGHHETTHMMIQHLLQMDCTGKRVLDMGCGTGILAILSAMKNAAAIDAIDIDNWCYLNTVENAERNSCSHINAFEGDASLLINKSYDIIIANINRNILMNDIATYASCLTSGGVMLLSGFYSEDLKTINVVCENNNLNFVKNLERNNWVAAQYVKM